MGLAGLGGAQFGGLQALGLPGWEYPYFRPPGAGTGRSRPAGDEWRQLWVLSFVFQPQRDGDRPRPLFILFGVYGDVQRVKILFNKRTLPIGPDEWTSAGHARHHHQPGQGESVGEMQSASCTAQHTVVQFTEGWQPDAGPTKDFTNAVCTVKKPGSKNYQNFPSVPHPPVSTYPPPSRWTTSGRHSTPSASTFRPSGSSLKTVRWRWPQLNSVEDAATCLSSSSHYQLGYFPSQGLSRRAQSKESHLWAKRGHRGARYAKYQPTVQKVTKDRIMISFCVLRSPLRCLNDFLTNVPSYQY